MCEFIKVYFLGCHHFIKFKIQICTEYILAYQDDLYEPTIPRVSAENLGPPSVTCGRLANRGETFVPPNTYDSVLAENCMFPWNATFRLPTYVYIILKLSHSSRVVQDCRGSYVRILWGASSRTSIPVTFGSKSHNSRHDAPSSPAFRPMSR